MADVQVGMSCSQAVQWSSKQRRLMTKVSVDTDYAMIFADTLSDGMTNRQTGRFSLY